MGKGKGRPGRVGREIRFALEGGVLVVLSILLDSEVFSARSCMILLKGGDC